MTLTTNSVSPGNYILSVKYDPTTLDGYQFPPAELMTAYDFEVSAGDVPSGSASVTVKKKGS